ncbi:MAG: glycosyltransferase family 2 protein [Planctomycetaceae bacterium]
MPHRPASIVNVPLNPQTQMPAIPSVGPTRTQDLAVSFCTTCMNRLDHLRETLPVNLDVLRRHGPSAELVVLDYGSTDGMREWIEQTQRPAIDAGLLAVYHVSEPRWYHSAHAKNVAHRLSRYGVVCNLDADNFLSSDYVAFLTRTFADGGPHVTYGTRSSCGRVAIRARDFESLGGYDESFEGWGTDDVDLVRRAAAALKIRPRRAARYNRFISHSDELRTQHMQQKDMAASKSANVARMRRNLAARRLTANLDRSWGDAMVAPNYDATRRFRTIDRLDSSQDATLPAMQTDFESNTAISRE